jgi:Icc protein
LQPDPWSSVCRDLILLLSLSVGLWITRNKSGFPDTRQQTTRPTRILEHRMNDAIEDLPRKIRPAVRDVVQLLQITDCHIFATAEEKLGGLNTRQSFEKVATAAIANNDDLDLVLATGDLSQDGSAKSYQYLAQQFDQINLPTFWLPGNHDDLPTMHAHFSDTQVHADKQILIGDWQIILLDSTIKDEVHGRVAESELKFLDRALRSYPDIHALVCLHHQAQDTGSEWLDLKGLKNSEQLQQRLSHHDNLRGVLWGHVHQEAHHSIDGVEWMSTPSSCVQFKPGNREFALGNEAPGYRYLSLYSNGKIETSVQRIDNSDLEINLSAQPY